MINADSYLEKVRDVGIKTRIGNHTFRATGITAYQLQTIHRCGQRSSTNAGR